MPSHTFKLGIFLNELQLPLDEGLEEANELGVEFVWFSQLPGKPPIADLSDAEADDVQRRIEAAGLEHMKVSAGSPFKFLDLTEVTVDTLEDHEEFKADFRAMVRSMQLANRFGVGAVSVYSFAWPGEYTAEKPTWPMRWMTRGGIISDAEMDKLVKAYTLMVEQAEKHDVDLVLSMMPWNYTNTTANFRRVAERIGSDRIKVMWGAADNYNCGENDVSTRGFVNIEPYVFGTARQRPARQRRREARLRLRSLRRGRHRLPHALSECSRQRPRPLRFDLDPLDTGKRRPRRSDANTGQERQSSTRHARRLRDCVREYSRFDNLSPVRRGRDRERGLPTMVPGARGT